MSENLICNQCGAEWMRIDARLVDGKWEYHQVECRECGADHTDRALELLEASNGGKGDEP